MAEQGSHDRLPPYSREAERSVLGSMLRDNAVIGDVVQIIRDENFYTDAHQKIFKGITALYDKGHPADLVTLAEWLKEQKFIEDVGAYAYLAELWDASPTAANAEYYARIVRDKALVRGLIHASTEILRDAYDQNMPADELVEAAERQILDVAERGIVGEMKDLEQALREAMDRLDKRLQNGEQSSFSGLPTGFVDLDEKTAGLQNSELIIIGARPSTGKTAMALNIARYMAVDAQVPVFFVSLEQSRIELAERMLCSQAKVDSHKLRKGHLNSDDLQKLFQAADLLSHTKLFIDDSPGQGMLRIAANARRLKLKQNIRIVFIDYLQLIEPDNRRESRQEQVAGISRRLKFLARELEIPVVAMAQVNRSSEDRQDHRPRLADLRESGCLAGDTLVTLADSGSRVPLRELVGQAGFNVWALDELTFKLKPAEVTHAFATGVKPVFRLETRLGRVIRATGNHRFRTLLGWKRLDELKVAERLALSRVVPNDSKSSLTPAQAALLGSLAGDGCTLPRHSLQYTTRELDLAHIVAGLATEVFGNRLRPRINPERGWYQVYLTAAEHLTHGTRNPLAEWLDTLGVFGFRAWQKRAAKMLFEQPTSIITMFLRHAWSTDGCIRPPQGQSRHPAIYYGSSSEGLTRDIQALLLRVGVNAVVRSVDQGKKGRPQHTARVMGHQDIMTFANVVGAVGDYKTAALRDSCAYLSVRDANTNRDVIPREVWRSIAVPAMQRNGITLRGMQKGLGMSFMGTGLYKQNVSRERVARLAKAVGGDEVLDALASSDVYWDEIRSITPDGVEEVFDLTVPGPANFVANDIVVHNSIEQDADTVMLLHRPEMHEPGQHEGVIEVIVAKQRNGPTGDVTLTYLKQFMRFENFAVEAPFGYGGQ
jgi:replicative DNA helicase